MIRAIAILFLAAGLLGPSVGAWAQQDGTTQAERSFPPSVSGLPIPRFVSLKSQPANMRTGPGVRYPIRWVYLRKGLPLMITAEFEYWRRVRDPDGAEGWVHKSLLRGQRTVMVTTGTRPMHAEPNEVAPVVAEVEQGVIADLVACRDGWCRVEVQDLQGWLQRSDVFGVLPEENFER